MTLRSDATAAWSSSQNARKAEAKAAIGAVLTPFVVTPMTFVAGDIKDGTTMAVFTDGDIFLGAQSAGVPGDWKVFLVKNANGWTILSQVTSLEQLGKILPTLYPLGS